MFIHAQIPLIVMPMISLRLKKVLQLSILHSKIFTVQFNGQIPDLSNHFKVFPKGTQNNFVQSDV